MLLIALIPLQVVLVRLLITEPLFPTVRVDMQPRSGQLECLISNWPQLLAQD